MALSNSQYDAIMRTYQQRQLQNKHDCDRRRAEVYGQIPAVKELEDTIGTLAVARARQLLDGRQEALKELKAEIEDLREQKRILLKSKGFPEDYMQMRYLCPDCRDTGYVEGRKCHCFRQAEMKLLYAQSNVEEVIKRENFSTFSYEYFDDTAIIPEVGKTVKAYMRQVEAECRSFVEGFGKEKANLLFMGAAGVGKTFLTNCIAKELIDRYCSVIYLSANDLFDIFSRNKFERQTEEDIRDMCRHILSCDLLIIDDLGTELNNTFTSSQLFYCMNERLNSCRATIISTNLTLNELRDKYTERVTSRIISSYRAIPLYGADIRYRKRSGRTD